jgi:hypothetical protein
MADQQTFMQALTTEHFTLQTARAVAVNEGNGRTALYVGALSSTLVALALVAQRSPLGEVFFVVALTVLPAVFFLGLVTYVRVLQSSVEDIIYARAINRIRHYYTEIDPAQAHYFLLSGRDDVRGALDNMYVRDTWTQFLFTMPSAVAVINGLLGGVTVALAVVTALHVALLPTVLAGMASGTVILALHVAYQVRRFARMRASIEARFPSQRRPLTTTAPAWHSPRWRRRRTGSGHADPGRDRRGGAGRAAAFAPAGPGRGRLGGAGAAQP